jgi:hypothetical protein
MDRRITSAFQLGGFIKFWESFFFCNENHLNCNKFIYLFTEPQLVYLKNWWYEKTNENKSIREDLLMSQQNCFMEMRHMKNGKICNVQACYIKQEPLGKKKTFFELKLKEIVFKAPEIDERKTSKFINFFDERFTKIKILQTPDERKKYLTDLFAIFGKEIGKIFINFKIKKDLLLYLGDDCGCYPEIITYCNQSKASCPFKAEISLNAN